MEVIASSKTIINSSSEKVFSIVSDMARFGDWFPEVISIKSNDELATGEIGKKYLETVSVPFRGSDQIEITVVDSVPSSRFVTEGRFPPLLPRMEIEIHQKGNGVSELSWSMFSRNNNFFVRLLLLPVARKIMQKRANIGVLKLKALIEAPA